jgi:hypothetical protein
MTTLGVRIGKTGMRCLVRLLSGPDSPDVEFEFLSPETLRPSPLHRGMAYPEDLARIENEFRKIKGLPPIPVPPGKRAQEDLIVGVAQWVR